MERQTKHRILGILVLLGLIVILLPFFQTSNELPSEAALVKTPPFPDEAVQTNNTPTSLSQGTSVEPLPLTVSTAPLITPIPENAQPSATTTESPAATIAENDVPAAAPVPAPAPATSAAPAAPAQKELAANNVDGLPEGSERETAEGLKPVKPATVAATSHKASKPKATKKSVVAAKKPRKRKIDGYEVIVPSEVAGLRANTWAVQLGSFKSKSNAMRLVNVLRTRGYRTFVEQPSSNGKGLTKVLVGPEHKKESAHVLASKLEKEVHIRGMVVHYNPLAL